MTMEETIAEIERRGYAVNNLFQYGQGFWRCNLRKEEITGRMGTFYDFANGTSASEALVGALAKTKGPPAERPIEETDFMDLLE